MTVGNADRNLLLGILAYQYAIITKDQLVAGIESWLNDKGRPLADILREQGALDDERRVILDALVDDHVKKHAGDLKQSLQAVSSAGSVLSDLERLRDPDLHASLVHLASSPRAEKTGIQGDDPYATRMSEDEPTPSVEPQINEWLELARDAPSTKSVSLGIPPNALSLLHRAEKYQAVNRSILADSNRYVVEKEIGKGGMGVVSVVNDADLRRHVAFKTIKLRHVGQNGHQAVFRRFVREAQITAQLSHPNIVPVYDFGILADESPYFSMPIVSGETLGQLLDRLEPNERLNRLPELVDVFLKVCDAVAYAHARGVIHRDIKPDNILVGKNGDVRLVDWGLAKTTKDPVQFPRSDLPRPAGPAISVADPQLTLAGSIMGTPAYMAPEQLDHHDQQIDFRTDVFGLGGVLFEILTGARPNPGKTAEEALYSIRSKLRASAKSHKKWPIPMSLATVSDKALAIKREDRFQSASDLTNAVRNARDNQSYGVALRVIVALIIGVSSFTGASIGLACSVAGIVSLDWSFWSAIGFAALGLAISSSMEAMAHGNRRIYGEKSNGQE